MCEGLPTALDRPADLFFLQVIFRIYLAKRSSGYLKGDNSCGRIDVESLIRAPAIVSSMARESQAMMDASNADNKNAVVEAVKAHLTQRQGGVFTLTDSWDDTRSNVWGKCVTLGEWEVSVSYNGGETFDLTVHKLTADGTLETAGVASWRVDATTDWVDPFTAACPNHRRE